MFLITSTTDHLVWLNQIWASTFSLSLYFVIADLIHQTIKSRKNRTQLFEGMEFSYLPFSLPFFEQIIPLIRFIIFCILYIYIQTCSNAKVRTIISSKTHRSSFLFRWIKRVKHKESVVPLYGFPIHQWVTCQIL
jgi:hypothetical protein